MVQVRITNSQSESHYLNRLKEQRTTGIKVAIVF